MSRLSLKFYTDDWVARPSNTTANENLIHYIANSARLSGYATVRDLARAFGF